MHEHVVARDSAAIMISVIDFVLMLTGTFLIWTTKGFKGRFDDEMVAVAERNSAKGAIRYWLGIGFWVILLILLSKLI
jgi:hypothetical protein